MGSEMCIRDSGGSETVAPPSEPGEPASPSPAIAADLDVPSARETALTFSTEIRPERDAVPLVCELLAQTLTSVSYTHLRAHETVLDIVFRPLLEKKKHVR